MVLFEDTHWIDQASRDLVARLIAAKSPPCLLLWTSRPEGEDDWTSTEVMKLGPLEAPEVSELVQALLTVDNLPAGLHDYLVEKSGGNPLFTGAFTAFLIERGDLRRTDAGFDSSCQRRDIGAANCSQHHSRPRRSATAPRQVDPAGCFSVRMGFCTALLADVVGEPGDALRSTLDTLEQGHFLERSGDEDGGTFAFTHALVRDALYSSLLSVDRSELHARVGKWLEHRSSELDNDAAIPELAFHYSRSGEDAKAVLYLKAAGRAALGTYSIDDASRAYREAIARVEAAPTAANAQELADLLQGLMRVLELQGRFSEICLLAERYLPRIESEPWNREAVFVLGHFAHALGHAHRFAEAESAAARAVRQAELLSDEVVMAHARLILMKVASKTRKGTADDRVGRLGRLVLPVAARHSDSHLELLTLFELANDKMHRGLLAEAREWVRS